MRITIEKTESGYSVTLTDGSAYRVSLDKEGDVITALILFLATPLPPKEPVIPACLHCGSKDAPTIVYGVIECFVRCDRVRGGCGSESWVRNSEAEAIALWAGVKNA